MKVLAATFIMALLFSALDGAVLFATVQASTDEDDIPPPSIPEFTVKFIESTYNITTTDPNTGASTTEQKTTTPWKLR